MSERYSGIVKFFQKSWGIITVEPGGEEVFVFYQDLQMEGFKTLAKNDRVSFNVASRPDGRLFATDVKKMEEEVRL